MAKNPDQYELVFVPHSYQGEVIEQRAKDGYINATAMCKAAGREWKHYNENKTTKAYMDALATEVGIPTSELIQSVSGGVPQHQGTWVHPQVAIHLAQWLSPKFAVQVTKWVYDWMSGKGSPKGALPYHLRRYVANQKNVPGGHFSVLNEITIGLIAPMEAQGYTLPEKLWPDISQGIIFAKYVRDTHGVDTNALPTYTHDFEDGRASVQARAYPNEWLAAFRKHFEEIWIPERAIEYFKSRDPKALAYLPKAIAAPQKAFPKK